MELEPLAIDGAWLHSPAVHRDQRGLFAEVLRPRGLSRATGVNFTVAQVNTSVSHAGVVRGIHWTDVPPGQAKYVTCVRGAVLDVVVDLRLGSPTFGTWEAVELDDERRQAVFLVEGLGHGFCALTEDATVVYMCSTTYSPEHERSVHPFDRDLGIEWPSKGSGGAPLNLSTSDRDGRAPSLAELSAGGKLPELRRTPDKITWGER